MTHENLPLQNTYKGLNESNRIFFFFFPSFLFETLYKLYITSFSLLRLSLMPPFSLYLLHKALYINMGSIYYAMVSILMKWLRSDQDLNAKQPKLILLAYCFVKCVVKNVWWTCFLKFNRMEESVFLSKNVLWIVLISRNNPM